MVFKPNQLVYSSLHNSLRDSLKSILSRFLLQPFFLSSNSKASYWVSVSISLWSDRLILRDKLNQFSAKLFSIFLTSSVFWCNWLVTSTWPPIEPFHKEGLSVRTFLRFLFSTESSHIFNDLKFQLLITKFLWLYLTNLKSWAKSN